ncbi:MAG: ABC transporter ATP-binding protein [Hyphomicrobiaceae bacterium]
MTAAEPASLEVRLRQTHPIPLDATFTCRAGQLLALVGPSGSGKTTILRAIAGLVEVADGRIACNGQAWLDRAAGVHLAPQARRVGLVFQDYALFPHMTAAENVATPLRHLPPDERTRRARELLDLVNLKGLEERRPEALSGGQRQRVALARALAREPAVLLLDEPFSAVDQMTRERLKRELVALRARLRIPIVLVTHDLNEAVALADRMVVLYRGETLQEGPPEDIRQRPLSPIVARLVGQTNVFHGTVARSSAPGRHGLIAWRGHQVEVVSTGDFAESSNVSWLVPSDHIVLHRRDRPSLGERENPVSGTIVEMAGMGEQTSMLVAVAGQTSEHDRSTLNFRVPTHTARRNQLAPGVVVTLSLLAAGIHLMPPEAAAGGP